MRSLRFALVAASLAVSTAFASPTDPKAGVEYVNLTAPQPSQTAGKKVEVIEFFMYTCPHCKSLEPVLEPWVKKQGDNIIFKRIHIPSSGASDPLAHLHLTLEAMGKAEEYQSRVFKAIHVDRVRLNRDDAIIDWAAKNGLDKAKFTETWNSFGVMTKLRRAPALVGGYGVDSVPTMIVDGKYMTSPAQVGTTFKTQSEPQLFQATLQVVEALVAKVQKGAK